MTRAFVLTGGGSLGAVQVGMLQALAERGITPDLVVGTSAGALNAAWVATHGAGTADLAGLASLWCRLRRDDIFPMQPWQVLRAVAGRNRSLFPDDPLRSLIEHCVPIDTRIEDARIPLHVVTADLLTGQTVVFSRGPLAEAVMASAAIPGVLPPVNINGRHLADGAIGDRTGLAVACSLGADEIVLLPTGTACALPRPPRSALGCALQAVSLLLHQRTAHDLAQLGPQGHLRLLPPLCPVTIPTSDFSHAPELIRRARSVSLAWIDKGNLDLPNPARFLATHSHDDQEHLREGAHLMTDASTDPSTGAVSPISRPQG